MSIATAIAQQPVTKSSIPEEVRASVGGFDVASRSILRLVDNFGGKVFPVKEINRTTEVRVLAFTRKEAEEFVNERPEATDILVFPGQEEGVLPSQPLNIAELATSLSDAYAQRLKRLLVDVSKEVGQQRTWIDLGLGN